MTGGTFRHFSKLLAISLFLGTCGTGGVTPILQAAENTVRLSLDQCLQMAATGHDALPVLDANLAIAEQKHRQAMAAYWPQVNLQLGAHRNSQDYVMQQPVGNLAGATATALPVAASPSGADLSALAGMGTDIFSLPPSALPDQALATAIPTTVDIKLLDRDLAFADLSAEWLLLDGGERRAQIRRAQSGMAVAKLRRDARMMEIHFDVHRYYQAAVLAAQLMDIADEYEARMEAALSLTKSLYEAGSEKVNRVDVLRNSILVEATKAVRLQLQLNRDLAQSALAHGVGLGATIRVAPTQKEVAYKPLRGDSAALLSGMFELNPDWAQMEQGLAEAEQAHRVERSRGLPRLALVGNLRQAEAGDKGGLDTNLDTWMLGVGIEVPVFRGMLNRARIREAQQNIAKRKAESTQLRRGMSLMMQRRIDEARSADQRIVHMENALDLAEQNRSLTERAYQAEVLGAEPMFEAIMLESFVKASTLKLRYEAHLAQRHIDKLAGTILHQQVFSPSAP